MRIIFMGTPDFAVPTLAALHEAGHEIAAVYSQPPRRAGRGKKERPSPVHAKAEELGLEVRHPQTLKDAGAQAEFAELNADVAIVVAYGLILPQSLLDTPKRGCLNVHASLLPRWRGAAPIQRAIEAGDTETGVTIMQMAAELDTGPMLATVRVPINDKTSGELHEELAEIGAQLMAETLSRLGHITPEPQNDRQATYAAKIDKAEARIDWNKPAEQIEREVRAFAPFPGSWFELDGERIKLLRAEVVSDDGTPGTVLDERLTIACAKHALRPLTIQRAGKPSMSAEEYLRGKPAPVGKVLP